MAREVHECSISAILISVLSFTSPHTGLLSSRPLLHRTSKCLLRANVTNAQTFGGNRSKINSAHILTQVTKA